MEADWRLGHLLVSVWKDAELTGSMAAKAAAKIIRLAAARNGIANVVFATGASQFGLLQNLCEADLPWDRVRGFHLDEYIGLSADHPASFCRYLRERLVSLVPMMEFHYLNGSTNSAEAECKRLNELLGQVRIDLALIGIGENGHLAFNDPPANFETEVPYITVELDEACRRQQLGEGWFPSLEAVPATAISMSIRQILKAHRIICTVPELRKAPAVAAALEGPESTAVPASILRRHERVRLFLDQSSASQLKYFR